MLHYAICFVMRSGSSWLCDLLIQAGLGVPAEYYYPLGFPERAARHEFQANPRFNPSVETPADYWRNVQESQGDVVGVKVHWQAFKVWQHEVDLGALDLKHIYLTRRDKLRQAISWYRADRTQRWSVFDQPRSSEPPFDRADIEKRIGYIAQYEQFWQTYLSDKRYLPLEYESLGAETIDEIAEFLGIEVDQRPDSFHQIMRDELTEEFVRLFHESTPTEP